MKTTPPLDTHSHISTDIDARDVNALGAFIFAMTRSPAEYADTRTRRDARVVWGIGVHPGLVGVNKAFDAGEFERGIEQSLLVGEVGLDGSSRVPVSAQINTFRLILEALQRHPRIVSIHSAGAQLRVLRELHRTPVQGVILHWWTGSPELTEEAVRLGCYFSLPPAMMSATETVRVIPIGRLLPETDHPYGDRHTRGIKRPGGVREVEQRLGRQHDIQPLEMRLQFWRNLAQLVDEVGLRSHFHTEWRSVLSDVR
ncbi:TatD family hydrolase [Monashia sp. NPDC004114]